MKVCRNFTYICWRNGGVSYYLSIFKDNYYLSIIQSCLLCICNHVYFYLDRLPHLQQKRYGRTWLGRAQQQTALCATYDCYNLEFINLNNEMVNMRPTVDELRPKSSVIFLSVNFGKIRGIMAKFDYFKNLCNPRISVKFQKKLEIVGESLKNWAIWPPFWFQGYE